jgi:DNA polymerase-1
MTNATTGRVHTHYAQAVAVTGRLSSNEPNLQNIPIRTVEGPAASARPSSRRRASRIASADYSQIELRIMAHISEDEALLRAFRENMDVHRATAAEVFGVAAGPGVERAAPLRQGDQLRPDLRHEQLRLARNLGIETAAAKSYIDRYFQRYPGVKQYMDETRLSAKASGYVETVFGRRPVPARDQFTERPAPRRRRAQAINAPMQGTAADLIKLSMVKVQDGAGPRAAQHEDDHAGARRTGVRGARGRSGLAEGEIPRLMAGVADLRVPLLAEIGRGRQLGRGALALGLLRPQHPTRGPVARLDVDSRMSTDSGLLPRVSTQAWVMALTRLRFCSGVRPSKRSTRMVGMRFSLR